MSSLRRTHSHPLNNIRPEWDGEWVGLVDIEQEDIVKHVELLRILVTQQLSKLGWETFSFAEDISATGCSKRMNTIKENVVVYAGFLLSANQVGVKGFPVIRKATIELLDGFEKDLESDFPEVSLSILREAINEALSHIAHQTGKPEEEIQETRISE